MNLVLLLLIGSRQAIVANSSQESNTKFPSLQESASHNTSTEVNVESFILDSNTDQGNVSFTLPIKEEPKPIENNTSQETKKQNDETDYVKPSEEPKKQPPPPPQPKEVIKEKPKEIINVTPVKEPEKPNKVESKPILKPKQKEKEKEKEKENPPPESEQVVETNNNTEELKPVAKSSIKYDKAKVVYDETTVTSVQVATVNGHAQTSTMLVTTKVPRTLSTGPNQSDLADSHASLIHYSHYSIVLMVFLWTMYVWF